VQPLGRHERVAIIDSVGVQLKRRAKKMTGIFSAPLNFGKYSYYFVNTALSVSYFNGGNC
jgi:hypothetical protein